MSQKVNLMIKFSVKIYQFFLANQELSRVDFKITCIPQARIDYEVVSEAPSGFYSPHIQEARVECCFI